MTAICKNILIRCDGSDQLGMGHVMRCVALAQALVEAGHDISFVCRNLTANGTALLQALGFTVYEINVVNFQEDAKATMALADFEGASIILIDLSHAETLASKKAFVSFLDIMKTSGFSIAVIEGMDEECISLTMSLPTNFTIVPYLGAANYKYKTDNHSTLLVGEKYFPLRTDFLSTPRYPKSIPMHVTRILLSLGGGNIADLNQKVLIAIAMLQRKNLTIKVVGSVEVPKDFPCKIEVLPFVSNMPEVIAWAECAIIGSGLTRYETAYIGTPAIVFSWNKKHAKMVHDFAQTGAVVSGGIFSEVSVEMMAATIRGVLDDKVLRSQMIDSGFALIDGKGASRLVNAITNLNVT